MAAAMNPHHGECFAMPSSRISFTGATSNDSESVAVMTTAGNYIAFNRAAAPMFPLNWDAMQELYRIALAQTLATLMPRRSVLDSKPSVN
jgi:hypothetical protein